MEYTILLELADDGSYSVQVPDLPGCFSCGDTPEEAEAMAREAIKAHIALLRERSQPVPPPRSIAKIVDAA